MAGVRVPVEFDGDFSQLMAGMERSLAGVSQGLTSAGGALTRGLTVPLVGLGTLAAREFAGFESSLTKIENHTSLTKKEIATLSPAIREVGTTAGLSGTEAADAFFFLQSGLGDSAEAMDALDAAAKGSAVGLGTTEDVSKALVSVMANYGKEAGSATEIMETFGSAAQASSLDADQMAIGLRGIIPQASQAGIGLDDLAATMAVISPNFNTGAEAGTAMEAALRSIVAPTKDAEKMLENAGTSAAELSEIAGKKGLSGAMQFLGETFDGSQKDLTRMLGSSEAASAVMGFLGADAEFVARTFGDVEKGTFDLDTAFKNLSDDAGFRVTQSLARMKDTLLDVGAVVLPIFADGLERASEVVQTLSAAFTKLPAPAQAMVIGIAGIAAAIGPALLLAGQFAGALSALAGAGGLGAVAQGALKFLGPVGLIVGALIAAYQSSEPFRVALAGLGATIQQVATANMPAFLAIGNIITTQLLPVLSSLFTQVAAAVGGLLAAILPVIGTLITQLTPVILQLVTTILPPLIALFSSVATTVSTVLTPILDALAVVFNTVLIPAIDALLPIVENVFTTIGGIIEAATKVFQGLIDFLTGVFTGDWDKAWTGLQTILQGIVDAIEVVIQGWLDNIETMIGESLDTALKDVEDGWADITEAVADANEKIGEVVAKGFDFVATVIGVSMGFSKQEAEGGWNQIKKTHSSAMSIIGSTVGRGMGQMGSTFARGMGVVLSTAGRVLGQLGSTFARGMGRVLSTAGQILGQLGSTFARGFGRVASAVSSGISGAVRAAQQGMSRMNSTMRTGVGRVVDVVGSIAGRVRGAVSGFGNALVSAGRALINGLINGIRAVAYRVASAARSVVQSAINAARSALGINSPSKVFAEIGMQSGQGMAEGLKASAGLVRSAAEASMTPQLTSQLGLRTSSSTAASTAPADVGEGTATVVVNEYGPRTDSAKRREVDWILKHPTRGRTFESGQLAIA